MEWRVLAATAAQAGEIGSAASKTTVLYEAVMLGPWLLFLGTVLCFALVRARKRSREEMRRDKARAARDARPSKGFADLSDGARDDLLRLREAQQGFVKLCDGLGSSRELALAKTRADEAVMWATAHVAAHSDEKLAPGTPRS